MAVQTIIPSTNVKMEDIRDTLNANGGNVTNILGSFFSAAAKINKWAKFKPVSYKGDFPANGVQWKGDANSTLWGLQVGIMNDAQSQNGPKEMYDAGGLPNYVYNAPVGGANSPYRLHDFCGYYPGATGIFIQKLTSDTETIYVSNTATSVKYSFSAYCSTHANAINFSDIEEVAQDDSTYKLRLVASVYKKGTDTLIAEYFNNSVKLYDYTSNGGDSSYDNDEDGSKKVDVIFDRAEYWGASDSITEIDVYLSIQTIRVESTPSGYFPYADKIIALPYSAGRYFKKSYKFSTYSRYVRGTKIHSGSTGNTRNWVTISSDNAFNYPGSGTPDIMFEVNHIQGETLTFQNGVCFLRSKHVRRDGGTTIVSGTLTSESGSSIPTSVTVPSGTSGLTNVYFSFGDMLQEPEYYNGNKLASGAYPCDIYLVKVSSGTETEVKVDTVPMYINVPS